MKAVCVFMMIAFVLTIPAFSWSAEDGATLYEANCSMCHGARGEGNPDADMPKIIGTSMTIEELTAYLAKGDPNKTMHASPVAGIDETQAQAIAAHVKSFKD
jgi:cytochrome c553